MEFKFYRVLHIMFYMNRYFGWRCCFGPFGRYIAKFPSNRRSTYICSVFKISFDNLNIFSINLFHAFLGWTCDLLDTEIQQIQRLLHNSIRYTRAWWWMNECSYVHVTATWCCCVKRVEVKTEKRSFRITCAHVDIFSRDRHIRALARTRT